MNKKDRNNVSCCNEKDCKPIHPDQLTQNTDGSFTVHAYGKDHIFPYVRVFPTEDKNQYACIEVFDAPRQYMARCLFIHFGT